MGERNRRGYLRAEQLKTGALDQHAAVRNGRYHEVTLGWQQGSGFYVHQVIRLHSQFGRTLTDNIATFDDVDRARDEFKRLSHQSTQRFTR
jgi:hypothetical protein